MAEVAEFSKNYFSNFFVMLFSPRRGDPDLFYKNNQSLSKLNG